MDEELMSSEIFGRIINYFKTVKPLVDFLNQAIDHE